MVHLVENFCEYAQCVKDLSRFGRNHIETGYYIEKYFSRRGIRFISVNDHAETIDGITNLNPYGPKNIPLINLMNEAASNELSKSKQSILNGYASDGKYIAPRAPYGYRKDPDDCHRLIIDPEAAANVKMIFGMSQHGAALAEIVRNLNQSGIMPPSLYARQNGLQGNYQDSAAGWNTRTLKKMLTNCTYMGKLIQGKDHIAVRKMPLELDKLKSLCVSGGRETRLLNPPTLRQREIYDALALHLPLCMG